MTTLINKETVEIKTYDLDNGDSMPDLAYFSVSETPHREKPKVYTKGFEYTMYPWEDLHRITAKYSYSTMSYENGYRLKDNVNGYGNIFIFDIDNKPATDTKPEEISYTAQELIAAVKGLKALIVSTRSHTQQYHRLRLILLADKVPTNKMDSELYGEVIREIIKFCGLDSEKFDTQCFSTDRQYAPNPFNQIHFYTEGDLLPMEHIVELATTSLALKHARPKTSLCSNYIPSHYGAGKNLKEKRAFINDNLTFDFMRTVLEQQGLMVKRNGSVVIPGNKTDALSVDPQTGVLADFGTGNFYDPVSVLHDYYGMGLKDATNMIYEMMGGVE